MSDKMSLSDVRYMITISVGGTNPNNPPSDEEKDYKVALINRCLNDYPSGMIIGKDISIGQYSIGDHALTMEKTTYHIGFPCRPDWIEEVTLATSIISASCIGKHSCNRFLKNDCEHCPNVPSGCVDCPDLHKPDSCYGCEHGPDLSGRH